MALNIRWYLCLCQIRRPFASLFREISGLTLARTVRPSSMTKDTLCLLLAMIGSALCWWPVIIEPNLNFPWWLPLALIALWTSLAASLSVGSWQRFLVAAAVGTFAGVWSGYAIWWPPDGIPAYVQSVQSIIVLDTLAAVLVSLVAGLAGRKILVSNENCRRTVWVASACCIAFGPVALGLTPSLVARRVKRNDQFAAERFEALKNAVERTLTEAVNPGRICDGVALKQHYSGPPFSEENWRRLTANYVRQDGYFFRVYCHEKAGYTIAARPARGKADGTLRFCTDESRKIGCGLEWNLSRNACISCAK